MRNQWKKTHIRGKISEKCISEAKSVKDCTSDAISVEKTHFRSKINEKCISKAKSVEKCISEAKSVKNCISEAKPVKICISEAKSEKNASLRRNQWKMYLHISSTSRYAPSRKKRSSFPLGKQRKSVKNIKNASKIKTPANTVISVEMKLNNSAERERKFLRLQLPISLQQ